MRRCPRCGPWSSGWSRSGGLVALEELEAMQADRRERGSLDPGRVGELQEAAARAAAGWPASSTRLRSSACR